MHKICLRSRNLPVLVHVSHDISSQIELYLRLVLRFDSPELSDRVADSDVMTDDVEQAPEGSYWHDVY